MHPNPSHSRKKSVDLPIHRERSKRERLNNPHVSRITYRLFQMAEQLRLRQRLIEVHQIDLERIAPVRDERQQRRIRRKCRLHRRANPIRQPPLIRSVRVHQIDFDVALPR